MRARLGVPCAAARHPDTHPFPSNAPTEMPKHLNETHAFSWPDITSLLLLSFGQKPHSSHGSMFAWGGELRSHLPRPPASH